MTELNQAMDILSNDFVFLSVIFDGYKIFHCIIDL